jgi:hypothetical protein
MVLLPQPRKKPMPRIKHTLWRVSNGWLLVPEEKNDDYLHNSDAMQCAIFKTLKEFSDQYPKRERKRRTTKVKEAEHAN